MKTVAESSNLSVCDIYLWRILMENVYLNNPESVQLLEQNKMQSQERKYSNTTYFGIHSIIGSHFEHC